MKKKGKFYFFKYFILAVVLFSLIKITDFSKKIYFVNKYDYNQRIRINYSYCKDGSIPFLLFIKENYKLNKKIKILDYEINPDSAWVFFNLKNEEIDKNRVILLNYKEHRVQEKIKFLKLKKGLFAADINPPHNFTIQKAIFSKNNNINKINLEIINKLEYKVQILLSKNFVFNNQTSEIDLDLDLENFDIRLGKLFIKISNNENNLKNIEEINLKVVPKYNLNNFKILHKVDNCYFLERLS